MSIVDKVKQMLGQHSDKAKKGVERAGDMIDERTGGKYADKVDKVQEKAGDYIERGSDRPGDTGRSDSGGGMGQGGEPGQGGMGQGGGRQP
ncbi:antitoxin [Actinomadura sp. GTD37]|uniref:antitoxin n=1 Tax=Actinomadura sp. GTD37 TaxID=1778030 RepID=UPI0035BFF2B2